MRWERQHRRIGAKVQVPCCAPNRRADVLVRRRFSLRSRNDRAPVRKGAADAQPRSSSPCSRPCSPRRRFRPRSSAGTDYGPAPVATPLPVRQPASPGAGIGREVAHLRGRIERARDAGPDLAAGGAAARPRGAADRQHRPPLRPRRLFIFGAKRTGKPHTDCRKQDRQRPNPPQELDRSMAGPPAMTPAPASTKPMRRPVPDRGGRADIAGAR